MTANVISGLVIFRGNETEIGMLIIIENMESEYIHDDSVLSCYNAMLQCNVQCYFAKKGLSFPVQDIV